MRPAPNKVWQGAILEKLKRLVADGLSAGLVSLHFPGTTRNTIIGACRRNDISLGQKRGGRKPNKGNLHREPKCKQITQRPARLAPLALIAPVHRPKPVLLPQAMNSSSKACNLMHLTGTTCRWPLWDHDAPYAAKFFCGEHTSHGPYCSEHNTLAIRPPMPRLGVNRPRP